MFRQSAETPSGLHSINNDKILSQITITWTKCLVVSYVHRTIYDNDTHLLCPPVCLSVCTGDVYY